MGVASRDQNDVPSLLGVSNVDGTTPVTVYADPVTHRLLVDLSGGSGTVTSVSVVTANGFAGTVANATTTPAITLSTTITGILKGDGTAISAATAGSDYTALAFKTIVVSGQSDIVADSAADTLTIAAGSNITLTTNAGTDTLTIAASGGSPSSPNSSIQFNSSGSFMGSAHLLYDGTNIITFGAENDVGEITGPNATVGNNSGGGVDIIGGNGIGAGDGGEATFNGGTAGNTGNGGQAVVTSGSGGATSGNGGTLSLVGGNAQGGNSSGGSISAIAGTGHGTQRGGGLDLEAGPGGATGDGGEADYQGGDGGATSGNGGAARVTGGNALNGGSNGGDVILQPGRVIAGGGTDGFILLRQSTGGLDAILDTTLITSSSKTYKFPNTSGTLALVGGTTALTIGSTTIASGTNTRILYDNSGVLGEYTLSGSGTVVAMATSPTFTTGATTPQLLATANDSGALGASGTAFADLFLASGGVINWAANNANITHSTGILTVGAGELRITSANVGTNADSVPTLSSTSTLTNKTLTSPTIQTSPVLAAATSLKFTVPSADPSATGVTTNEFNSGYSSTAIGDLVYLDSSATWQKAKADSVTTSTNMLGIALSVAASGAAVNVLLQGFIYAATPFPTFTIGTPVYISGATAALVTQTAPTTTDFVTRIVGYAIHADKMYFNPSNDWITHA